MGGSEGRASAQGNSDGSAISAEPFAMVGKVMRVWVFAIVLLGGLVLGLSTWVAPVDRKISSYAVSFVARP